MKDHTLEEKWKKQMEECDTYVMCSTLNQIVNYLPLKHILEVQKESGNGPRELRIVNITYGSAGNGSKGEMGNIKDRFPNAEWDDNFKDVVTELLYESKTKLVLDENTQIRLDRSMSIEQFKYEIEKRILKEDTDPSAKVIWNLTGGQRNELFAIERFIEQDKKNNSMVLYLEGNTQRYTIGHRDGDQWKYKDLEEMYEDQELTLGTVFKLAGYEMKSGTRYSFLDDSETDPDEEERRKAYSKIFRYYQENADFRENLVKTNKAEKSLDKFMELLDSLVTGQDMENDMSDKKMKELIKKSLNKNEKYPFGYFLEYLTEAAIIQYVKRQDASYKNLFNSLVFNVTVSKRKKVEVISKRGGGQNSNSDRFCQLDMVLLLNSGQMVVFECKSGGMDSTNAKAREYTAYALGGVYGKPVLVTPILKSDFKNNTISLGDKYDKDIYDNIVKALRAAERAGLDVCYLDSLDEDIKHIFNEIRINY